MSLKRSVSSVQSFTLLKFSTLTRQLDSLHLWRDKATREKNRSNLSAVDWPGFLSLLS